MTLRRRQLNLSLKDKDLFTNAYTVCIADKETLSRKSIFYAEQERDRERKRETLTFLTFIFKKISRHFCNHTSNNRDRIIMKIIIITKCVMSHCTYCKRECTLISLYINLLRGGAGQLNWSSSNVAKEF